MLDENINEFCKLILTINCQNEYIEYEKKAYDSGKPNRAYMDQDFDKLYESDIKRLYNNQKRLKELLMLIRY